jgi:hypothetical protein
MKKKRGNPNWGKPGSSYLSVLSPTSFEGVAKTLGLSPEDFEGSILLKEWVLQNKNQKYVPQDLLQAWGFTVEMGG